MWLSGWVKKSFFSACECIKEILFQFHSHLYYFCVLLSNILFYQNLFGSPSFLFFLFFFFFFFGDNTANGANCFTANDGLVKSPPLPIAWTFSF